MHGARNLNPVITLKNLLRRTYCPQAGGRCSVTGRLWPTGEELVKPARMTGELHRQPHRVGNAGGLFAGCKNGNLYIQR